MWIDSIRSEDVAGRERVRELAQTDPLLALKKARSIKHPWYRCQSLSSVAEHLDRHRLRQVLIEALEVAREQPEINRVVTVSSWPIRHLVKAYPALAAEHINSLVTLAEREPHTLRRADALYALASAVMDSRSHLGLIVPSLISALLNGRGWRNDRLIRSSVNLIQSVQPDSLAALVARHGENRQKKQLIASLRRE